MADVEQRGERVWRAGWFMVCWTGLIFAICLAAMGFFAYFGFVMMSEDLGIKIVSVIAILLFAVLAVGVSQIVRSAVVSFVRLGGGRLEYCVWDASLRLTYWRPFLFRRASVPLDAIRAVEVHREAAGLFGLPFIVRLYSVVTADGQRLIFNGTPLFGAEDQGFEPAQAIAAATGLSVVDRGTFAAGAKPATRADTQGAPLPMSAYEATRAGTAAKWTWTVLGLIIAFGAIMRGCSH